ncbi:NADPH-dependent FMN reductase [Parasphingorhabdus halotolerans]|uniref:NAD(P)H-dependent oxidoreductase n=1 Tax=Parasphingorhabdus halotolerans TaxID=2725558 RepID=A0A6H2DJF0_9SPHN|nr:NAD(P)H-dependent oxidoreductase [Parasphingorhabdus halotolerans]QJB68802.1 NAD(P)H-dependent oxidoreductase [Parasphingorhabdus halotolerans]
MTTLDIAIELASKGDVSASPPPFVVALGGTLSPNSTTEKALKTSLEGAAAGGAETLLVSGPELELPIYAWERKERTPAALHLVESLRRADGVIIGSPGYHGSISGLIKNALDYAEDMSKDEWPYLHGRPVGAITTGAGWQGAVTTLTALRGIVHALRGWNTPLGVAINTAQPVFDADGNCLDEKIDTMLRDMGREVAESARVRALMRGSKSDQAAAKDEG